MRARLAELERCRRAFPVRLGERECWARAEDAPALRLALGARVPDWARKHHSVRAAEADTGVFPGAVVARSAGDEALAGPPTPSGTVDPAGQTDVAGPTGAATDPATRTPLADLVLRHARTHVLITADDVARAFGLGVAVAADALAELAGAGSLLRLGGGGRARLMAPHVLTRVRNRSLAKARACISTPTGAEGAWMGAVARSCSPGVRGDVEFSLLFRALGGFAGFGGDAPMCVLIVDAHGSVDVVGRHVAKPRNHGESEWRPVT